jgi:NAD(P)-dependent dehydrogenase (short-subunit alcohol dehydrogenase family)
VEDSGMGLLDGQKAIVTGGGSGIGAAVARAMVGEGAQVAVLDLHEDRGRAVAEEIGGVAFAVNVVDGDAVDRAVSGAAEALGGLTCLVNNAGIGSLKPLHEYTSKEWDLLVDVNLKGTFNGLRAAVPHLRVAGAARPGAACVVNIASVSGIRPTRGESPYGAAKAGVIALTMSGALEYGPEGIRVNCVSPGFIRTALTEFAFSVPAYLEAIEAGTPLGRTGTAEDIADVVVFLASDRARFVTGVNLAVDGGSMLPSAQMDPMLRDLLGGG